MARYRGRVYEGSKTRPVVGAKKADAAVAGKARVAVFVVCDARTVGHGQLYGGAAIGRHGPEVASAIPQENIFRRQLQPIGQAQKLLSDCGKDRKSTRLTSSH